MLGVRFWGLGIRYRGFGEWFALHRKGIDRMSGYEGETVRLQPRCSRCTGEMRAGTALGVIPEWRTPEGPLIGWVDGTPKRKGWTRTYEIADRDVYTIVAYRCVTCGYIELYAKDIID